MSVSDDLTGGLSGQVVDGLFRLFKSVSSYEEDHPVTTRAAKALLASIQEASPPLTLQFVGETAFRDFEMVPLTVSRFDYVRQLTAALHRLGFKEISFEHGLTESELVELGSALAQGALGYEHALDFVELEHIQWRDIPEIRWGEECEEVDLETYCAAQVTLALMDVESIPREPEEPWPWGVGLNVVRRIENAVRKSPHQACRAAETAPGDWTPDRRALCVAMHTQRVLHGLEVSPQLTRATVHAGLVLAVLGLERCSGRVFEETAPLALARIVHLPEHARRGLDPHRLRVCALIHSLSQAGVDRDRWFGPHHMLHLAYEIERGRCPETLDSPLSLVDLLADAVLTRGTRFSPRLLQILIAITGVLPPGTAVQLEDGRTGTVIGPAADHDPWRPQVMVDGTLLVPAAPVSPLTGVRSDA